MKTTKTKVKKVSFLEPLKQIKSVPLNKPNKLEKPILKKKLPMFINIKK